MKNYLLFSVLLLILSLVGCQSAEKPTPTPFPTVPAAGTMPVLPVGVPAIPLNLADILANPEFFAGVLVEVTGQFGRLPRLVCGLDPHPGPTTWTLQDGETLIQAGGFDQPLRELFPDGLTMTVWARVEHWQGPIGCGKQAAAKDFWYLNVTRLISPDQIARVTLTPAAGDALVVETPVQEPTAAAVGTPESEDREPTAVPIPTEEGSDTAVDPDPTLTTPTPTPAFAPPVGLTVTLTVTQTPGPGTPTITPDLTTSTPGASPTPSPTLPPGTTATPTATLPPNVTPSNTPQPTVIERGDLDYYDAFTDALTANQTHNWSIFLEASAPITVSVIGEPEANLGLRLLSPTGGVMAERNQAGAGQVESLLADVTTNNEYAIQVYSAGGRATRYFIALWDESGAYRPMGTLQTNATRAATINDVFIHVWFFQANAGQTLDLQTTSTAGGDLLLVLLDPEGELLTYESGTITGFSLPETGWYSVEIEEYLLKQNAYQLTMMLR